LRRRACFLPPMRFDTSMAIKPEKSSRAKTAIPAIAPQLIPPLLGVVSMAVVKVGPPE